MRLRGKVAIVTGGSRGLGRSIALKYAENGADLVLVALRQEGLQAVKSELESLGRGVTTLAGDIAEADFCEEIARVAKSEFGRIDILVNNAGTISRTMFEELSYEEWHRVINVNLHGTFYLCQAVLPGMREQKSGKVINMSSQMARIPHPSASPSYEVSKAGMVALTRHLALQYAPYSICVNAIAPGSIDTDMPKSMSEPARERLRQGIPLKRLGEPEEVGELAVFLASEQSNYITGATISINGGSLMD